MPTTPGRPIVNSILPVVCNPLLDTRGMHTAHGTPALVVDQVSTFGAHRVNLGLAASPTPSHPHILKTL